MGLTEDQLREFRASFNHYDKDNSGQLDKNEFRSCLLSLGYALGTDPVSHSLIVLLYIALYFNGAKILWIHKNELFTEINFVDLQCWCHTINGN